MSPVKLYWTHRGVVHHSPVSDGVEYIRADLVDKLKVYSVHKSYCDYWAWDPRTWKPEYCTCGLTEVLKEME